MKVTNRQLEKVFGFSLSQVRRWAVLCFGRDPEADKGGGVRREYELDEAFFIYLIGIFITEYNMGQKEARNHIENIRKELIVENLLPSKLKDPLGLSLFIEMFNKYAEVRKNVDISFKNLYPFVILNIFSENDYKIEWNLKEFLGKVDGKNEFNIYSIEKYIQYNKPLNAIRIITSDPKYTIILNIKLSVFKDKILKASEL